MKHLRELSDGAERLKSLKEMVCDESKKVRSWVATLVEMECVDSVKEEIDSEDVCLSAAQSICKNGL